MTIVKGQPTVFVVTHHLVGAAEVAAILGVSRQRVAQLVTSTLDFPSPEVELSAGRIWAREAIERWAADHAERGPRARGITIPVDGAGAGEWPVPELGPWPD
ncbi:MAG TPA: hypothetical protein VMZ51_01675 [Acidimicrobiales bacterium]|nr:hypothetical protein [Acidimicrobiales bacterium]